MIWVLLAMLGVPIWLVVGALVGVALSRRSFRRKDGVFAFNVRDEGASKWPRRVVHGRQIRDVLVTNRGAALLRTEFRAVDDVAELTLDDEPRRPADAVGRLVSLSDGDRLEVAVSSDDAHFIDSLARARNATVDRDGSA
jgi:hypothetical protein